LISQFMLRDDSLSGAEFGTEQFRRTRYDDLATNFRARF